MNKIKIVFSAALLTSSIFVAGCGSTPKDLDTQNTPREFGGRGGMRNGNGGNRGAFRNPIADLEIFKEYTNGEEPSSRGNITKKEDNTFEIAVRGNSRMQDEITREELMKEMELLAPEERQARRDEMMNQNLETEAVLVNSETVFAMQDEETKEFKKVDLAEVPAQQFGMVWADQETQNATLVLYPPVNNNFNSRRK